ncbi:hypothetical protein PHYC_02723 [Phycisphaerales bacterium]|nr:hypothetical protein PHYC_02723 [Phycisphaerales bacterium]
MSHPPSHNQPEAFDELDPHHSGVHADHVIVGPMQLRAVLAILLVFTALTVGFAQAEQWASGYFNIVMPHWVNIAGAMTIAVIKALLVMAIFMQLKYDNPVNTLIMGVTFAALAVFIAFTGMDLLNRSEVYSWKAPQIVAGGTGNEVWNAQGKPITVAARDRYLAKIKDRIKEHNPSIEGEALEKQALAQYEIDMAATVSHGHATHGDQHGSSANRSRGAHGLSGALDTAAREHAESDGHEPAKPAGGH